MNVSELKGLFKEAGLDVLFEIDSLPYDLEAVIGEQTSSKNIYMQWKKIVFIIKYGHDHEIP